MCPLPKPFTAFTFIKKYGSHELGKHQNTIREVVKQKNGEEKKESIWLLKTIKPGVNGKCAAVIETVCQEFYRLVRGNTQPKTR